MDGTQVDTVFERRFAVSAVVLEPVTVPDMLRDIPTLLQRDPEIAAFQQIGPENHFRLDFADVRSTGHNEICAISGGLYVQLMDCELTTPMVRRLAWPDLMRIRIAREGFEGYAPHDDAAVTVDGPSALISIEPSHHAPFDAAFAGRHKSAYVCLDRATLAALYKGREEELPAVLQTFIKGELARPAARRAAIRPELLRCLDDLHDCELEGLARTLFMRAKAMEILCYALKMLEHDEGFGAPDASLATARGVLKAQQVLTERFASPPSLEDLAREVGVSRSSLCAGFRQLHGKSIYGYIQDLRMERARALLTESQDPVTEIAYAVGFCHLSSFTVAVQRRFGMSPSELRRTARSTAALT